MNLTMSDQDNKYIIGLPIKNLTNCRTIVSFKQRRRLLANRIVPPLVWGLIRLIWKTCKVRTVIGTEHIEALLKTGDAFIPCYWHQQQIFCLKYLLDTANSNASLNLGYLISPSADGDLAAGMFGGQGVHIIRGSATRGGAQALREIYTAIRHNSISPIVTPDGPTGPIYECKPGVAMLSQLSRAPLLPLAYAGSRMWRLRSWDQFMLPLPFSSIVIGIGEPLVVDKALAADNFDAACKEMNNRLTRISDQCQAQLTHSS